MRKKKKTIQKIPYTSVLENTRLGHVSNKAESTAHQKQEAPAMDPNIALLKGKQIPE